MNQITIKFGEKTKIRLGDKEIDSITWDDLSIHVLSKEKVKVTDNFSFNKLLLVIIKGKATKFLGNNKWEKDAYTHDILNYIEHWY